MLTELLTLIADSQENSVGLSDYDPALIDPNVSLDPCRSAANLLGYCSLLIVFSLIKLLLAQ